MRSGHPGLITLALAFLSLTGAAQQHGTSMGVGTAAGNSTIVVRVTYQQNHGPAAGMRVALISPLGGMADVRTTDGKGSASFENVSGGRYRVRITGPNIETKESESFDAGGSAAGPFVTENIEVKLTETAGVEPGPALTQNIPEAAKQEFMAGSKEMDKKHWQEAKGHFQKAIAAFPKYVDALNGLGLAEAQLQHGKDAVEAFRSATQLDPSLQQANLYLGQFYYDNAQYKDAEPYLLHAATDQPNSAQLLTALANSELQNGEIDRALDHARKVPSLPNHKQFAISHLIVAQALAGKGQDGEIAQEYEKYLKEAPDSPLAPRVKDALAKLKSK